MNLEEEVLWGHLVTAETKKLWAVEIDMAKKLLEVCEKYGLKIWADGGTLLGAVRHKGFIPWDDDMDFVMMRDDFEKLMEIGPQEFKYPYFFQSYKTDNFWGGIIKIRNSETTYLPNYYKYLSVKNRGIFIDVLVMDGVPEDISTFEKTYNKLLLLRKLLENCIVCDVNKFEFRYRFRYSFVKFLLSCVGVNKVEKYCNSLLKKQSIYNSNKIALVDLFATYHFKLSNIFTYDKKWYDETVYLDFHDIMIPVPKYYHEVLTCAFGDYMKPVKGGSMHEADSLYFDTEKSYKCYEK